MTLLFTDHYHALSCVETADNTLQSPTRLSDSPPRIVYKYKVVIITLRQQVSLSRNDKADSI